MPGSKVLRLILLMLVVGLVGEADQSSLLQAQGAWYLLGELIEPTFEITNLLFLEK